MRSLLGVIAGAVVAFLCVMAVEYGAHMVYPPPPGFDFNDPEQLARAMAAAPTGAFAIVAAGWFVAALIGAWVAAAAAKRAVAGWIVTLIVVAACIANLLMIPGHPAWMWAAGILLPLIAGWLAQRLAGVPA
jgi:hypothetical protein